MLKNGQEQNVFRNFYDTGQCGNHLDWYLHFLQLGHYGTNLLFYLISCWNRAMLTFFQNQTTFHFVEL